MSWTILRSAAVVATLATSAWAAEPPNLGPHKAQIRAYVKSGEYEREIAAVTVEARTWIEQRAKSDGVAKGSRLAVVFDLDETLLSNWPEIDREDFGFEKTAFPAWIESAQCPPIKPVREVYQLARRLGIEVIFITGRHEGTRAATEKNLRAIDCADYAALIMRPADAKEPSSKVKAEQRARFEAEGHVIIANIGDQESDLAGGHAERTFKLPDPFYVSP